MTMISPLELTLPTFSVNDIINVTKSQLNLSTKKGRVCCLYSPSGVYIGYAAAYSCPRDEADYSGHNVYRHGYFHGLE